MPIQYPYFAYLKIEDIKVPRIRLHSKIEDQEAFKASISNKGVEEPIIIYHEVESNIYWLGNGENRLNEYKELDKHIIPAIVYRGNEDDAIKASVRLNVNRGSHNVGGLCKVVKHFRDDKGMKLEQISKEMGLSLSYVKKLSQIANRPDLVQALIDNEIGFNEAYARVCGVGAVAVPTMAKAVERTGDYERERSEPDGEGLTGDLKEALESGKMFDPKLVGKEVEEGLSDEDLKPYLKGAEKKSTSEDEEEEYFKCVYCNKEDPRKMIRWLPVHSRRCKKETLFAISEYKNKLIQKMIRGGSSE